MTAALRIALLQMRSGIDCDADAARVVDAATDAARGGAPMLFAPDMSGMFDRGRKGRSGVGWGTRRVLSDVGATILSVPSAFARPTGAVCCHRPFRVQAGAAAQGGVHVDGGRTGVGFVGIDLVQRAEIRERIPVIAPPTPLSL